ncbi:MAG TPA: DUF805 domain-containing protein [Hypericibacter adhaerens]|jgi:uncharacterized membrane protein YhaH (DUF805 family)|uniref:DUF805 domain-containing protein n=1 Tax=Hypericibacter adhaerens TaxID=2602016 RepID=A0A5J6MY25_9PROT|nr:DUF805 domain-containing protein [Hypericibacter adhaerens]QEX22037.1 DUF805 domain-containing protein [Hypericibacter adhaerens]HWA46305.1 DUF805 domain-containing protein [Hypericibacter adhaerens]
MATVPSVTAPSNQDLKWLYLSLNGRINRSKYWLFGVVAFIIIGIIAGVLDAVLGLADPTTGYGPITIIASLVLIYPAICIQGKRWHDRNKSAWWILINFVPIIGSLWALIECGFLRGTVGDNRFGPDPLGGK